MVGRAWVLGVLLFHLGSLGWVFRVKGWAREGWAGRGWCGLRGRACIGEGSRLISPARGPGGALRTVSAVVCVGAALRASASGRSESSPLARCDTVGCGTASAAHTWPSHDAPAGDTPAALSCRMSSPSRARRGTCRADTAPHTSRVGERRTASDAAAGRPESSLIVALPCRIFRPLTGRSDRSHHASSWSA